MILNIIAILFALAAYGSAIWGGVFFFNTDDKGAQKGKVVISVTHLTSTLYAIYAITFKLDTRPLVILLALLFYAFAVLLFWSAVKANKSDQGSLPFIFSSKPVSHLVRSGVYKYIRHPFYTAYILSWIAPVVCTTSSTMTVFSCVMIIIYTLRAFAEEKAFMNSKLSDEYACYRAESGMLLPRIGSLRDSKKLL